MERQRNYLDEDEFDLKEKLICLATVPKDDVMFGFQELRKEDLSESFQQICDYFEETYVCPVRGAQRVEPKYAVVEWNVHKMVHDEYRTNNAVEGWNDSFNKFNARKHLVSLRLISRLKDEKNKIVERLS